MCPYYEEGKMGQIAAGGKRVFLIFLLTCPIVLSCSFQISVYRKKKKIKKCAIFFLLFKFLVKKICVIK